jgi:hypothetical protein
MAEVEIASFSFKPDADYPFRSRDEVVHEEVLGVLQSAVDPSQVNLVAAKPAAKSETSRSPSANRIYRGQVIDIDEHRLAAEKTASLGQEKRRPVRIYRGQVMHD